MYSDIFDRTTISAIEILTSCPIDATYIYIHIYICNNTNTVRVIA